MVSFITTKNYDEAIKYFNQVYTTGDASRRGDASLGLGRVYVDQNNYAEAKKYLLDANEIGIKTMIITSFLTVCCC